MVALWIELEEAGQIELMPERRNTGFRCPQLGASPRRESRWSADPCRCELGGAAVHGRMSHGSSDRLPRHKHSNGFFALVLSGGYVEAGDTGRHRVGPGDVIAHRPYEHHLDRFSAAGAEVLILPMVGASSPTLGSVADPDALVRIAERDIAEAACHLSAQVVGVPILPEDWPDMLAADLIADPGLSLSAWALSHSLHPGSMARGFSQQFGINPASFRAAVRARRAYDQILTSGLSLSAVALEQGFADQAHMTRAVKRLAGNAPGALRRLSIASAAAQSSSSEAGLPAHHLSGATPLGT